MMTRHRSHSAVARVCAIVLVSHFGTRLSYAVEDAPIVTTVTVDAGTTLRTMNPRRLGGTNIAMWTDAQTFASPVVRQWMTELRCGYIRLPGGSWSNQVYWNGNGVRDADGKVNSSKVGPDGFPAVDYRAYVPSFAVDDKTLHPGGWPGNTDVKTLEDFVRALHGPQPLTCPNAGTGRAVDAAEWVKWSDQNGYDARLWEIGNELGGSWEPGTTLPFGRGQLTGPVYAQRFNDFVKAMRAVDPTVHTGGCAFAEDMIRDCGANVNFVSIHSYPGSATMSDAQLFSSIKDTIGHDTDQVKQWIHQYQPGREKQIELDYSEWNLGGGISGAGMFGGLWSSIFLGEMASHGIDFATQWDAFTSSGPDGHALIYSRDGQFLREPEYYALWLWNNYMGDKLVPARSANDAIYTYASRSDDAAYVMLLNTDRDRDAKVDVQLEGFNPATSAEAASISGREYYWNLQTHQPQWSTGPRFEKIPAAHHFGVTLAPYSMTYVRIPDASKPGPSPLAQRALAAKRPEQGRLALQFVMPSEMYAGDTLSGDVLASSASTQGPFTGPLAPATITADAPAALDRTHINLDGSVGRFSIRPTHMGRLTLTVRSGDAIATHTILVKSSVPRPVVVWDFTSPPATDPQTFSSEFTLSQDDSKRANREVARVELPATGAAPDGKTHTLLQIHHFPEGDKLKKENIRGVVFDLMTSSDFATDDPDASISIVMQGPANWWMPIGTVPFKGNGAWKTHAVDVKLEDHIKAMPSVGTINFILNASKPVKGSIFFDHVGLMMR